MSMRILAPRLAINKTKVFFLAGLLTFSFGLASFFASPTAFARPMDCDDNAIMWCGFGTNSEFISKTSANNDGHGHTDLQSVYNHFGLSTSEYSRFQSTAKDGTMYRDGRVVVGSDTVMTSGKTLGRESFPGSSSVSISGKTYYMGSPEVRWVPGTDSLPVKVMFNSTGVAEIVILTSCGNPVDGSKSPSGAECKQLTMTPVSGKINTYRFTALASASGNAKITKYVYDFGDGSKPVTTTNPSTAVEHTYTKPGEVTATLTVYASAPGGTTITTTSETCKKKITVAIPFYECVKLTGALVNQNDKYTYMYTATMRYGNGAQFVSADFDFGDGAKATGVKASNATSVAAKHSYTKGGDYTVQATLRFNIDGKTVTARTCKMTQTVINPFYRCVRLGGEILSQQTFSYRFVASFEYGNGAQFISADFDFGDSKTESGVKSTDGKTVTVDHTYAQAGTYSSAATLRFTVNGKPVTAPTCRAVLTPTTPPTPECKPGIPEGDVRCSVCPYDPSIPADDTERCVAPITELPNTGAGNVIALGSIALVGGFLMYRHMLFKRHKAAYLAADRGESPLPLADPLQSEHPLAATPLDPQRHRSRLSLRRRRQF